MIKSKFILVAGCRRSGTTFLGNLINTLEDSTYVEEPFNKLRGMKSIPDVWYPYLTNSNIKPELKEDIKRFFKFKNIKFRHSINNNDTGYLDVNTSTFNMIVDVFKNKSGEPTIKRIFRIILKNKHYLSYIKARILKKEFIVIKDALASLSANYLLNNQELKSVFIYRDPRAYFYSMLKLDWYVDLNDFGVQKELIKDYPFVQDIVNEEHTFDNRIINEWIIVNRVLLDLHAKHNIVFVSQEELASNPLEVLEKICSKLDLDFNKINQDEVIKLTKGKSINPKNIKNVRRDSLKTINQWKGKLSDEQLELINQKTKHIYEELESIKL